MTPEYLEKLLKDESVKELFKKMLLEHLTIDVWRSGNRIDGNVIKIEVSFDDEVITEGETPLDY